MFLALFSVCERNRDFLFIFKLLYAPGYFDHRGEAEEYQNNADRFPYEKESGSLVRSASWLNH